MIRASLVIVFVASAVPGLVAAASAGTTLANPAAAFGARESVAHITLSPDGSRVAWLQPGTAQVTGLYVAATSGGAKPQFVISSDGKPFHLRRCNWAASDRLVCYLTALASFDPSRLIPFTRLIAVDTDGRNFRELGRHESLWRRGPRQYDGNVLDWLEQNGVVLMERNYIPDHSLGSRKASNLEGLGVDRIDTRTLKTSREEKPDRDASRYYTDGEGAVRLRASESTTSHTGYIDSVISYDYRLRESKEWRKFGTYDVLTGEGVQPLQVDGPANAVYVLQPLDGRDALYRVKLDETLASELVFSHPTVDVVNVVTLGARQRPLAVKYVTGSSQFKYFDPADERLVKALGKALPTLPSISLLDASRDEKQLLVHASNDQDPGRYYVFDRSAGALNEILLARPQLEGVPLGVVQNVTYTTADGTKVSGYLTLPPGSNGKNLPGIVLPHGGPAARDVWGFDWLAQFFAHRGFAVLQPNFRGSASFGDDWLVKNGYQSWQTAIGDVNDAGRWLLREGIVAPGKLAILGWAYGGYAALQANVLDPDLFKAVVAIAPVTDLAKLKEESRRFTDFLIVSDSIGSGPHLIAGSPAANAANFKAPVLLFHGDRDDEVGFQQSRRMDAALRAAGKHSELVPYPGLEHDLDDSAARADLLTRSDQFLRRHLGIATSR